MKITQELLGRFRRELELQERSPATVQKYLHDVGLLAGFAPAGLEGKPALIAFKEHLLARGYAVSSVNSMLAAVNRFAAFLGHPEWKVRFLRMQRRAFLPKERELGQAEYRRLVQAAERRQDARLALLLQTVCSTGIRVSEVRAVTVEALRRGTAQLCLKGKIRQILLPRPLCKRLLAYCRERRIRSGPVFVTRTGRPLDRSNIWKMLKRLAAAAHVPAQKVFPHNLRHLFACTYYKRYKDIAHLADILGHSSIDTTRIYTANSRARQERQLNGLCLLC